jgi:RNA polymerase sigma-70 factor (ECF subfamily)
MDDLVARAKRGDRKALEGLLEKHLTVVYRFVAVKLGPQNPAVEDVVQETMISSLGGVSRLRGDDDMAFARWLLGIARYKVADHLRDAYARPSVPLGNFGDGAPRDDVASPEDIVAGRARGKELWTALKELTPEQEEVLTLKFVLGYDNDQIARMTHRTVGAVKALQHRGLGALERLLGSRREAWMS